MKKKKVLIVIAIVIVGVIAFATVAQYQSYQRLWHVEGEIFIPESPDKVWYHIATRFDKIENYSAGVNKSYYVNGHTKSGMGAQRNCEVNPSGFVTETITNYDQTKKLLEFEVTDGDLPLHYAVGRWELYPADGGTRVVEKADFRMKFFFMNGPAHEDFQQGINQNLAGLKNLILNDESANPDNITRIMTRYWTN